MRVFRLMREKYGIELSGKGAALSGNRWNSKGTELIYCADSRALAMAEVAVHLPLSILPRDYVMFEIDIPVTFPSHPFQKRICLSIGVVFHLFWTHSGLEMGLSPSGKAAS